MKRKLFDKYEIKNIIIEALISRSMDKCLKKEYQYSGDNSDVYVDIIDKLADEIVENHFAE